MTNNDAGLGESGYSEPDNGQLQEEDTLIADGGDDDLGESVESREGWSAAERFGSTVDEQRQGESLDQRLRQERPEEDAPADPVEETVEEELDDIDEELAEGGDLEATAEDPLL